MRTSEHKLHTAEEQKSSASFMTRGDSRRFLAGGDNDKVLHPMIIHDVFVRALCIFKERGENSGMRGGEKKSRETKLLSSSSFDAFLFFQLSQAANQPKRLSNALNKKKRYASLSNFSPLGLQGLTLVVTQNVVVFYFFFFFSLLSLSPTLPPPPPLVCGHVFAGLFDSAPGLCTLVSWSSALH